MPMMFQFGFGYTFSPLKVKANIATFFFFNRILSVKVPELHQIQRQEVLHMDLRRENDINTARVC